MAKISIDGLYQYEKMLGQLSISATKMAHYAIFPAAGEVLHAIKSATPTDTGDLRDSEILTRFVDEENAVYTMVVFDGYDQNGTPNSLKARALESGTSRMKKRPFIRPTINRISDQIIATMSKYVDEYITNLEKQTGGK